MPWVGDVPGRMSTNQIFEPIYSYLRAPVSSRFVDMIKYLMPKTEDLDTKASDEPSFHSDEIYYFNTHRPRDLVLVLQNRCEGFDPK